MSYRMRGKFKQNNSKHTKQNIRIKNVDDLKGVPTPKVPHSLRQSLLLRSSTLIKFFQTCGCSILGANLALNRSNAKGINEIYHLPVQPFICYVITKTLWSVVANDKSSL